MNKDNRILYILSDVVVLRQRDTCVNIKCEMVVAQYISYEGKKYHFPEFSTYARSTCS